MATIADTVSVLEREMGFEAPRCRNIVRALIDASLIGPGAPGVAVNIGAPEFILLMMALASGATIRTAADSVVEFSELVPQAGEPVHGAEQSPRTAWDTLSDHARDALGTFEERQRVAQLAFEVVEGPPELAIHHSNGAIERFVPPGTQTLPDLDRPHRRSTTITGTAFVAAVRSLFIKEYARV